MQSGCECEVGVGAWVSVSLCVCVQYLWGVRGCVNVYRKCE